MKKFLIITFLAAVLLVSSASAEETCRTPSGKSCFRVQQAAVAQAQGLEFLGINYSTDIGDILAGVYRFALGLIGIAALIMFVLGGVTYMTAADSQDRVKQGQTFMRNAVFGLVLALLSYLILYTINPDIVEKLNLDIKPVKEADVKIEPLYIGELPNDPSALSREFAARRQYYVTKENMSQAQSGAMVEGETEARIGCSYSDSSKQQACQAGVMQIYRQYRDIIATCLSIYYSQGGSGSDVRRCREDQRVSVEDMRTRITEYKIKTNK